MRNSIEFLLVKHHLIQICIFIQVSYEGNIEIKDFSEESRIEKIFQLLLHHFHTILQTTINSMLKVLHWLQCLCMTEQRRT